MARDIRDALRALRGAPVYTAVALVVLALGVGASTAIFSVVDAVMLRGLPFDEHDRLVAVTEENAAQPLFGMSTVAPQNYVNWKDQQQVFEAIAAIADAALTLREPGAEPEELRAQRVDPDFFVVLRQQPALGRPFQAADAVEGQHFVMVISHGLWQRRFGSDPAIVGSTLAIEGGDYEVVGVMPHGFSYPVGSVSPTELWVPLVIPADDRIRNPNRRSYYLSVIARLREGISIQKARAQMDQIAAALERANPAWNKDWRVNVIPLQAHLVGDDTRQWMWMLLGAVGIVLLIACVNVANLMLVRATAREREIGIRAALGAARSRLMRQLIVESMLLSLAGAAIGLVLAWWGVQVLRVSLPDGVPRVAAIALDFRVLAVATSAALVTGLALGLVPALQVSRPNLTEALNENSRRSTVGTGRQFLRSSLVVVEVALAMILLVAAGLFIGSFMTLINREPGFDVRNLLTASLRLREAPDAMERGGPVLMDLVERAQQLPGVRAAAAISGGMPLSGSMSKTRIRVAGRSTDEPGGVSFRKVTPGYHQTMRIPLLAGRYLTREDREGGPAVVLLNEAAVKQFFAGVNPIGQTVTLQQELQVVGIVGNVRPFGPESEIIPEAYIPLAQDKAAGGEIILRTEDDPYAVLPALKAAAYSAAPDVPLRGVNAMEELLERRLAQRKFNMVLLSLFGIVGLVISAVGIYGVMAYVVAQRTHEIGIRKALGATRGSVVAMVMGRAAVLVSAGLLVGALGAYLLGATLEAFLFRVEPSDPRVFTAAVLVLTTAALLASAVPASRAASVDPMVAMRE